MACIVLAITSYISTFIHLFFLYYYPPDILYFLFILFSLLISILNHSFTYNLLKYIDRLTMFIGFFITYNKSFNYLLKFALLLIIPFYFLSKKYNIIQFHVICHILITIINISIIKN